MPTPLKPTFARLRYSALLAFCVVALVAVAACGPPREPEHPRASTEEDGARPVDSRPSVGGGEEPQISGLMGTIDAAAVEKAFDRRMNAVRGCLRDHGGGLSYVGGTIQFFFVIGTDGVPARVVLERSELGRHELETCLLKLARSLTFAKPSGGRAEARYAMRLPPEGDEAREGEPSLVRKTMLAKAKELEACKVEGRPSTYAVTFYLLPQGRVQTAGVASTEDLPEGFAACVATVITTTTFPDPLGEVLRMTYRF